jgi:hypothetical protein
MDRYFATHSTVSPPAKAVSDDKLRSLIDNGFVLLPNYFSESLIRRIHDLAMPMVEAVRLNVAPTEWRTIRYAEDGIYRLHDCGTHIPEAQVILNDAYLQDLGLSYLNGARLNAKSNYIDYKPDLKHDYTSVLHIDNYRSQVKIFTLLSNVTFKTAPMVYWSKSHRDSPWRRRFDHAFWLGDAVGTTGQFPPFVLREQRDAIGADGPQEVAMIAPAGSVIIADTRGVHRASCLIEGYRLEIVQKFST